MRSSGQSASVSSTNNNRRSNTTNSVSTSKHRRTNGTGQQSGSVGVSSASAGAGGRGTLESGGSGGVNASVASVQTTASTVLGGFGGAHNGGGEAAIHVLDNGVNRTPAPLQRAHTLTGVNRRGGGGGVDVSVNNSNLPEGSNYQFTVPSSSSFMLGSSQMDMMSSFANMGASSSNIGGCGGGRYSLSGGNNMEDSTMGASMQLSASGAAADVRRGSSVGSGNVQLSALQGDLTELLQQQRRLRDQTCVADAENPLRRPPMDAERRRAWLKGQTVITLSETPTVFLYSHQDEAVSRENAEEVREVKAMNAYYAELVEAARVDEGTRFQQKATATFAAPKKSIHCEVAPPPKVDAGAIQCASWMLRDAFAEYMNEEWEGDTAGGGGGGGGAGGDGKGDGAGDGDGDAAAAAENLSGDDAEGAGDEEAETETEAQSASTAQPAGAAGGGGGGVAGGTGAGAGGAGAGGGPAAPAWMMAESLMSNLRVMERAVIQNYWEKEQMAYRGVPMEKGIDRRNCFKPKPAESAQGGGGAGGGAGGGGDMLAGTIGRQRGRSLLGRKTDGEAKNDGGNDDANNNNNNSSNNNNNNTGNLSNNEKGANADGAAATAAEKVISSDDDEEEEEEEDNNNNNNNDGDEGAGGSKKGKKKKNKKKKKDSTAGAGSESPNSNQDTSLAYTSTTDDVRLLWVFRSPLTRGRAVTCMCWNNKECDILAVGYSARRAISADDEENNNINNNNNNSSGGDNNNQSNDTAAPASNNNNGNANGGNNSNKNGNATTTTTGDAPQTDKQGMICLWSLKNMLAPELVLYYPGETDVTALAFSYEHPSLLAVGSGGGGIVVFDIQHDLCLPSVSPTHLKGLHTGAVWDLAWTATSNNNNSGGGGAATGENKGGGGGGGNRGEYLMSVAADGRVVHWIVGKSIEKVAPDLMLLKRPPTALVESAFVDGVAEFDAAARQAEAARGGRKGGRYGKTGGSGNNNNNNNAGGGAVSKDEAALSRQSGGMSFALSPVDTAIYVVVTEDGTVYQCNKSQTETYDTAYAPHTELVYRVRWCPFSRDCFATCSADWSVHLYTLGRREPLLTFDTPFQDSVNDLCFSPLNALLFVAVSAQGHVNVWSVTDAIYPKDSIHYTDGRQLNACLFGIPRYSVSVPSGGFGGDYGPDSSFTQQQQQQFNNTMNSSASGGGGGIANANINSNSIIVVGDEEGDVAVFSGTGGMFASMNCTDDEQEEFFKEAIKKQQIS